MAWPLLQCQTTLARRRLALDRARYFFVAVCHLGKGGSIRTTTVVGCGDDDEERRQIVLRRQVCVRGACVRRGTNAEVKSLKEEPGCYQTPFIDKPCRGRTHYSPICLPSPILFGIMFAIACEACFINSCGGAGR